MLSPYWAAFRERWNSGVLPLRKCPVKLPMVVSQIISPASVTTQSAPLVM